MAEIASTTAQTRTLDNGDLWHIGVLLTDDYGLPVAATVTGTYISPTNVSTALTFVTTTTGYYDAQPPITAAGRWVAIVTATGYGTETFFADVMAPVQESAMPTLATAKAYLGTTSFSDAQITAALATERVAQARVCRVGAEYPADLAEALHRRVARNLAMRGLPLAVLQADSESGPLVLPGRDPEVRRLEAPYRKVVQG